MMIANDNAKRRPLTRSTYLINSLVILSLLVTSCGRSSPLVATLEQFDGGIAFASYRPETHGWLYLLNTNSRQEVQIQGTENSTRDPPSWSPDGRALAFVAIPFYEDASEVDYEHGEGLTILDAYGRRTAFGPCRTSPAWSPDGQRIAFHKSCNGNSSLSTALVDGSDEREIVHDLTPRVTADNTIQVIRISWAPDGDYITYDSQDAVGTWYIWVVASNGETPRQLTPGRHPAWSPAEDEIAFDRGGSLWTVSVDDGTETQLLDGPVDAEWPTWSPDGQQLVFEAGQGADSEIYLVNSDGSGLDNLTDNSVWDGFPAWRPGSSMD